MNALAPRLLRRWLTLLMVGLLAFGPFLHSHFGVSHDTGFHLDGVHAVHAIDATGLDGTLASEEETPALGVSASLPHPEDDGQPGLPLALLLVLPLLALRRQGLPRIRGSRSPEPALFGEGSPPPSLAPPLA